MSIQFQDLFGSSVQIGIITFGKDQRLLLFDKACGVLDVNALRAREDVDGPSCKAAIRAGSLCDSFAIFKEVLRAMAPARVQVRVDIEFEDGWTVSIVGSDEMTFGPFLKLEAAYGALEKAVASEQITNKQAFALFRGCVVRGCPPNGAERFLFERPRSMRRVMR